MKNGLGLSDATSFVDDLDQCDQIGILLIGLGHNFSFESGLKVFGNFLAHVEKRQIVSKDWRCYFWVILEKLGYFIQM